MEQFKDKKIFLYMNFTPTDDAIGTTKKIKAQIKTFRKLGLNVTYSAYIDGGIGIFDNEDSLVFQRKFTIKNSWYQRLKRRFFLIETVTDYIKYNDFDYGFLRWCAFDRPYINMLKAMKQQNMRVVVESLGYFPGQKGIGLMGKYIVGMTKLNQKHAGEYIDLVLSEGRFDSLFGVRAIRIDNGVEIESFRSHRYCGSKTRELNLISVANETMYHAYDRIIKSIYAYMQNGSGMDVKLHLVGLVSDKTKKLIIELGLSQIVILYGKQFGAALEDIYDKCNIGIGPLGQHRIGGKQGTGLKTKEYFAKGIPYIFSGGELLVPKEYPYVLEFPSDESLIDINKVVSFYNRIKDDTTMVEHMRSFAREHYSWVKVLRSVFEAL
ncbi:MAG: hypothetical protein K0Q75_25 [Anaerospora sp.]|nr:hypothetical protein [Anaerospora sp.]